MNKDTALRILGLSGKESKAEIKKKYRALMHNVHPDAKAYVDEAEKFICEYEAHEINAAYEYLSEIEYDGKDIPNEKVDKQKTKEKNGWQAAVNNNAFVERDIYQYIEDADGNRNGRYVADRGKFLWSSDEDFKLFLLSIYNATKKLLENAMEEDVYRYQGELAYLLAQQFVYPEEILDKLAVKDESQEGKVYFIPSMLETEGKRCMLKEGTMLYPSRIRNHKLYLMDKNKKEIGYVSFVDDRLYYAVVPMFEQHRVQVKVQLSGSTHGNNNKRGIKVRNLDLWIKMNEQDYGQIMVSISDRIREILKAAGI